MWRCRFLGKLGKLNNFESGNEKLAYPSVLIIKPVLLIIVINALSSLLIFLNIINIIILI